MDELVLRLQRFPVGHKLYTDKEITNTDATKGFVGTFKSVFGQLVDSGGTILNYTVEREDKLISEGEYTFDLYYSEHNKAIVPRLTTFNGEDISERELELHPCNWVWQLTGCAGQGTAINLEVPMLVGSQLAFNKLMKFINKRTGKIIYETLPLST